MSSDASTFGETEGGAPPIVSVTGSATVRGGGNYTVKFPAENAVLAYVRDQTGTVLYLEVQPRRAARAAHTFRHLPVV